MPCWPSLMNTAPKIGSSRRRPLAPVSASCAASLDLPPSAPLLLRRQSSASVLRSALASVCTDATLHPQAPRILALLLKRAMIRLDKVKSAVLREYLGRAQEASQALVAAGILDFDERHVAPVLSFQPSFTCAVCRVVYSPTAESLRLGDETPEGRSVVLGCCGAVTCQVCLACHVMDCVAHPAHTDGDVPCPLCPEPLPMTAVTACLTPDQLAAFFDATLQRFLTSDNTLIHCPNRQCRSVVSFAAIDSMSLVIPAVVTDLDANDEPLREGPWREYQQYRLRCPDCLGDFCAACLSAPYHKGFTCAEWIQYEHAGACRFCLRQLTPTNQVRCFRCWFMSPSLPRPIFLCVLGHGLQ